MPEKFDIMDAAQYLKDVPVDKYFRLSDGRVIRNLQELHSILSGSGDSCFYDHVTADRNDFVTWIQSCLNHHELYSKLLPIKDKASFLSVLGKEIECLKDPKLAATAQFFNDPDTAKDTAVSHDPLQSKAVPDAPVSETLECEQVLSDVIVELETDMFN